MNLKNTALMLLVLAVSTIAGADTCKVCKKTYTTSRLSRTSMTRIVGEVASRHGVRGSRSHDLMVGIARRESNYKPTTRNRKSSAYGLFGFLNSTWKGTGVVKTTCPHCQTEAAMRYIKRRYGTIEKAYAFWLKHKWY